jgi:serine/threonine protein kinase
VVDFGFAAPLEGRDGTGFQRTFRGTLAYMAPEILNREPYQGDSVDLFALGCILFVMRSGAMPFDKTAQANDEIYKFFAINRVDKYWATHE